MMFRKSMLMSRRKIILGIDPGSVRIGYGLIKKDKRGLSYQKSGLLEIPKKQPYLVLLEKKINQILAKEKPDLVALEKLYFVKNQKTALEVAQSRGVIVCSILKRKIPLIELNPSQIKLAITGNGRADKKEVAKMVKLILKLKNFQKIDDVTDALAIAIAAS